MRKTAGKATLLILTAVVGLTVGCATTSRQPANTLTSAEKSDGWVLLFDGETLDGWRRYGSDNPPGPGWVVDDGLLKKKAGVSGGDIITEDAYLDFELSWEWMLAVNGNNGVKYLVTEERRGAPGHEYQLLDDAGHADGGAGPKRHTASFYDVLPPKPDKAYRLPGEWNHSRIVIRNEWVEHWLNGVNVLTYRLGSDELKAALAESKFRNAPGFGEKIRGHIMLTDHADECWFRNIKLRKL